MDLKNDVLRFISFNLGINLNQIHPVRLNTLNADLLFEGLVHREASAP